MFAHRQCCLKLATNSRVAVALRAVPSRTPKEREREGGGGGEEEVRER